MSKIKMSSFSHLSVSDLLNPEIDEAIKEQAEKLAGHRPFGTIVARKTREGIKVEDSEFDKYVNHEGN